MTQPRLTVRRCGITAAKAGVARLHRHLAPPPSALVAFEVVDEARWPRGWALVGRPVSPTLQARGWVELTRCATDGSPNACSALYGAAARWARANGTPIVTYTRVDESGAAMRGAGWVETGRTATRPGGRPWSRKGRPRKAAEAERVGKIRWSPPWCAP